MAKTVTESKPAVLTTKIIPIIGAIFCALMVINYFANNLQIASVPQLSTVSAQIQNWVIVIANFALVVAFISLTQRQALNVKNKKRDWLFGVCTMAIMWSMVIGRIALPTTLDYNPSTWFANNIKGIGQAAMFALHGFFVVSAAMRALKVKSLILLPSAIGLILILLYLSPFGDVLWPGFTVIGQWLNDWPLQAGSRAITLGAATGAVTLGYRVVVGAERRAYGIVKRSK